MKKILKYKKKNYISKQDNKKFLITRNQKQKEREKENAMKYLISNTIIYIYDCSSK